MTAPARNTSGIARPDRMTIGGREFVWGRKTYVMAALNVTPDSFSGDGVMAAVGGATSPSPVSTQLGPFASHGAEMTEATVQAAVERALRFEDEGADIIDIGGESTRPPGVYSGTRPVSAEEEMARIIPVIQALKGRLSAPVSIDTRKAEVARAAAKEGAALFNDVSMLEDPDMARAAAKCGVPVVISHTRPRAEYADVMANIVADLSGAAARAEQAGVPRSRVILDPGIGFAKRAEHSLEALRRLRELSALGLPVLVGASRKSFIGAVLGLPVTERLEGTAATVALAIANGADIVRVHDVKAMVRVARMSDALVRGWQPPKSTTSPLAGEGQGEGSSTRARARKSARPSA